MSRGNPCNRRQWAVLVGVAVLVVAALGGPLAAPARAKQSPSWVESFSRSLSGWSRLGPVAMTRKRVRGQAVMGLLALQRSGGSASHRLPTRRWALSLDVGLDRSTRMELGFGSGVRHRLRLTRTRSGAVRLDRTNRRGEPTKADAVPLPSAAAHLQAVRTARGVRLGVNGQELTLPGRAGARLVVTVRKGSLWLDNLLATSASDPGQLLLHRLSDLQQRVAPRSFLVGADSDDQLHLGGFWTRGFLAGALWHARDLTRPSDLFQRFALDRTAASLGFEDTGSHDLGFVYENSSLAAYRRLCRSPLRRKGQLCEELRSSVLVAAERLVFLARTNDRAGTIGTWETWPKGDVDTIVDSMMNLPLLYWAASATGNPAFREVAARHAAQVASLLVRPDGSTAQSVHIDRFTGKVLRTHTHQGISADSTWARGQAWAVYGFTTSAAALRDPALLAVAERTAGWVAANLPASGVPPYDYDAGPSAVGDRSAGVITAAALYRLDALCRRWPGGCTQARRWRPLAKRMLSSALRQVSRRPPLGFFGGQVGTYGGSSLWDDQSELVYGLHYALEAVRLAGSTPSR